MEHLTLPSVGASFKKWGCCTPILSKALAHSPNFQIIKIQNSKNSKKWTQGLIGPRIDPRPASD
jgi:hypothetical protein